MALKGENVPNLLVAEKDVDIIKQLEKSVVEQWNGVVSKVDQSQYFEKVVLNDEQRKLYEEWKNVAIEVASEFGCGDLVNFPLIVEIPIYRLSDEVNAPPNTIDAITVNVGGGILFLIGRDVDLTDDGIRKVFQHELGHQIAENVVSLDEEGEPMVLSKGMERVLRVDKNKTDDGVEIITYTKGSLLEPIAELFSYYCSDKMHKEDHVFGDLYAKEVCFLLGVLGKMSDANNTSIKEEFALLFKSFNHRDYSWNNRLIASFEKDDTHENAIKFAKNFNNIETRMGVDVSDNGSQLSDLAKQGGFLDSYEKYCGRLVNHNQSFRFEESGTWMG